MTATYLPAPPGTMIVSVERRPDELDFVESVVAFEIQDDDIITVKPVTLRGIVTGQYAVKFIDGSVEIPHLGQCFQNGSLALAAMRGRARITAK